MDALIWVTPRGWEAVVDRAADALPLDARVTLLYVLDGDAVALASAPAPGRLGRRRPPPEADTVAETAVAEAEALLAAAAARLGRPATSEVRRGRIEHEVARASDAADLLVLARDGEARRGPRSFGRRSRFVVDHAGCDVVVVWPEARAERDDQPLPPPPPAGREG